MIESPLLVACVVAPDDAVFRRRMAAAGPFADLLELRLDTHPDPDVEGLVRAATRPVIATCRRVADGGDWSGDEGARRDLLRRAIGAGAAWVDVEADAAADVGGGPHVRRIVSRHDVSGVPDDLHAEARRLEDAGADVVKLAVTARSLADVTRVLSFLGEREPAVPVAAHAMGEIGRISRLIAPRYGGVLVYAAAAPGAEAAPGQPTIRDLREVYLTHRIRRSTRLHAVLGGDVSRSPSPAAINAAFEAMGLDRAFVRFTCSDPVEAVRALPGDVFDGFSVTMPHKEVVHPLLLELDPAAREVGAVNTLIRTEGGWRGANTDAPGILDALEAAGVEGLEGKIGIVVGTGGAARAAAAALDDAGARIVVAGRTPRRAVAVATRVRGRATTIEDAPWREADVVVQATPLGSRPDDPLPFDPGRLRSGTVVLDAVVIPPETRLLRAVEDAGGVPVSGMRWFVAQAARQIRLWSGQDASTAVLDEAAGRWVNRLRPIALVGLRGSGKTVVGERLADALGRPFVDTDERIARQAGRPAGDVLREEGEGRFRDREERVVRAALGEAGPVVALGGGAVEREAVRCLLEETSTVIWLDAPDEILLDRTRDRMRRPPLLDVPADVEVARIRACREPWYRGLAAIRASTAPPRTEADVTDELARALDPAL